MNRGGAAGDPHKTELQKKGSSRGGSGQRQPRVSQVVDVEDAGGNKNSEYRLRYRLILPTGRNRETLHSTKQRDHDRDDDLPTDPYARCDHVKPQHPVGRPYRQHLAKTRPPRPTRVRRVDKAE